MVQSVDIEVGGASLSRGADEVNQDAWLASEPTGVRGSPHLDLPPEPAASGWVCAVADGVGGAGVGGIGSSAWCRAAAHLHQTAPGLWTRLPDWVCAVESALRDELDRDEAPLLGTSLALVWVQGARLAWTNVGVTGVLLLRRGELRWVARPQTRKELARRQGHPPPAAPSVPARVLLLGPDGTRSRAPLRLEDGHDFGTFAAEAGDRLLLVTGSVAQLSLRQLGRPLSVAGSPRAAAELVCQTARRERPHKDATALVIHVNGVPMVSSSASASPLPRGSGA